MEVTRAGFTRGRSRCRVVTLGRLIGQLACRRREADMSRQTDLIVSSCGAAYNNVRTVLPFVCSYIMTTAGHSREQLSQERAVFPSRNLQASLDSMRFTFRYRLTVFQDRSKENTYSSQTVLEISKL